MPRILPQLVRLAYGDGMNAGRIRFGTYEFAPVPGELWRSGIPVKLQAQPARVLAVLLAHAGEVVSRETLQREVWGPGVHVDFERGLNFCIAQVRSALRDSADSPRFIATVPKQGYRFIAPVETSRAEAVTAAVDAAPAKAPETAPDGTATPQSFRWSGAFAAITIVLVLATALAIAWPLRGGPVTPRDTVIVVPFYNETGRAELDALAKNLGDVTVARLASPERLHQLSVIGNAPALRHPFARTDVQKVAQDLGAQWVVVGQLKADDAGLRLVGHLIRAGDMKHLWANTFDDPTFTLAAQERAGESIAAAISHALASN